MNEEIKEILDILNRMAKENKESDNPLQATVILFEILYKVLDYITNLQEENERLKELVNPTTQIFIDTQDMEERYGQELYEDYLKKQLEDYKLRCEKAIEYLEKYDVFKEFTFPLMKRDEENQVKSSIDYQFKKDLKKNLLNILQGVGKDEYI